MADFEKLGAFYIGRGYDAAKDTLAAEPLMYDSRDLTTHARDGWLSAARIDSVAPT